ncbi:PLP-dependent aminotransferase family protein [Chitinophaga sp. Mgbs1]|uniref:PLP-dependent aminotransferase family protein n=1 Tax=Chitinophaga solisilvae TaxID=1233460 RepID=A0A3S1CVF9_9BACT|nr:PLP-dependent aminotransferase family protein [Chitinophaga solisilvae]
MTAYRYEVFTSDIERHIAAGTYKPGHKLPSVRVLKEKYKTSISTIQNGYEYLMIKGLVESVPKSGYYVSRQPFPAGHIKAVSRPPAVRDAVFRHRLQQTTGEGKPHSTAAFHAAAPGDLLMPQKLLLRTMQQVIRESGAALLRYYPPDGSPLLKEHIVKRAAGYNTLMQPENMLITDGALQALYIALAAVCMPGDVIAVESPCVFSVLEVISMLRLRVVEIPCSSDGFDIDFLKKSCIHAPVKAIVVTPNFHNPTGLLMTTAQKKQLLTVAQYHNIPLIENDIYGDLHFGAERPENILSMDDSGLVMTCASWSKSLAPGIRVGWLYAGKFFSRAEQLKFSLGSSVAPVYQETVAKLLQSRQYDRHVRAFRLQLARNAFMTINLLTTSFPAGIRYTTPQGGYGLWVQLPARTDISRFYVQCDKIGVQFTPGASFSYGNDYQRFFRIVFADKYTARRKQALRLAGQNLR